MEVSESAMRTSYSSEITANPQWYELARRATGILNQEVLDSGVVIPTLLADWGLQMVQSGPPLFELRLSDVLNNPSPVLGRFTLDAMQQDTALWQGLHRLWGLLLQQRSRRQAEVIGLFIKSHPEG